MKRGNIAKSKSEKRYASKVFSSAPEENEFVLSDGSRLKSILELASALRGMSDDVFRHHVNDSRNDFCCWIRDVFQENELAEELGKAYDKSGAELVLLRRIVEESANKGL